MIWFIDEHHDRFGVEAICRTLRATTCGFITSRAYRATKTRPASARALRDEVLLPEIKRIHQENYSVYGVRKMHHAMLRSGWQIGPDQVARLMRIAGLQGVRRGRKPPTTRPAGHPDTRLDLVERRFTAERPNQLWVADITYVRVLTGLCYVAFITDVCTRRIVGWAVSASLHTTGLPLLTLEHALLSTSTSRGHEGLIHHSDKGSQYVSLAYSQALITAGVTASVGTVGDSLLRQRPGRNRQRALQDRTHPFQTPVGVHRDRRTGHDGVGPLVEHNPPTRSPELPHPHGNRSRLHSPPGPNTHCAPTPEKTQDASILELERCTLHAARCTLHAAEQLHHERTKLRDGHADEAGEQSPVRGHANRQQQEQRARRSSGVPSLFCHDFQDGPHVAVIKT